MDQEINLKLIDFSLLQIGDKFFINRQEALNGKNEFAKIASTKNLRGMWVNSKNSRGLLEFVQYDSKVFIRK